jgi:hypothetical protein
MNEEEMLGPDDKLLDAYCGRVRLRNRRPSWVEWQRDELWEGHPVQRDPGAFFEAAGRLLEATVTALERKTVRGTLATWQAATRALVSADELRELERHLTELDAYQDDAVDRCTDRALPGRYAACLMWASLVSARDRQVAVFASVGASAKTWSDLIYDGSLTAGSSQILLLRMMIEMLDELPAGPDVVAARDELVAELDYREQHYLFFDALDRKAPAEWTPEVRARLVAGPAGRKSVVVCEFMGEAWDPKEEASSYAAWVEAFLDFHASAIAVATPTSLALAAELAEHIEVMAGYAKEMFTVLPPPLRARLQAAVAGSSWVAGFAADYAYELADEERFAEASEALRFAVANDTDDEERWYNLACYAARSGSRDEAFAALERAIMLEPENRKLALDDEDLASLRGDPRYAALTG